MILSIVPALSSLASIWAAVCTLAALQDISGKDIKVSLVLLLVAGVAVTIVAMGIAAVQL
jgi:hypothetical protein